MSYVPFPLAGRKCPRCNAHLGHNSLRCATCADALDGLGIGQWLDLEHMRNREHDLQKAQPGVSTDE
mgnify:FL=1